MLSSLTNCLKIDSQLKLARASCQHFEAAKQRLMIIKQAKVVRISLFIISIEIKQQFSYQQSQLLAKQQNQRQFWQVSDSTILIQQISPFKLITLLLDQSECLLGKTLCLKKQILQCQFILTVGLELYQLQSFSSYNLITNILIFCYKSSSKRFRAMSNDQPVQSVAYDNLFSISIRPPTQKQTSVNVNSKNSTFQVTQSISPKAYCDSKELSGPHTQSASRIKLKDYLFLAQTSSTKTSSTKRKNQENQVLAKTVKSKEQKAICQAEPKDCQSEGKKNKYFISNSQMLRIIHQDISSILRQSISEIQTVSKEIAASFVPNAPPTNEEMIDMYELRSLAKDKLKASVEEMKVLLEKRRQFLNQKQSDVILEDHQFSGDITYIKEMFSQKYLASLDSQHNH